MHNFRFFLVYTLTFLCAMSQNSYADWKISQHNVDGDARADLIVDGDLLSAKFSAKGGNIISLMDKQRNFENAKLFPSTLGDGLAQIKLSGLTSEIENAIYKFSTSTQADGSPLVEAVGDVPIKVDGVDAGSLRVTHRYTFETGATRIKVSTQIQNRSGRDLSFVPWIKHLLYRGKSEKIEDLARVAWLTPYGVYDSNKPVPGRNGLMRSRVTSLHYLVASNWISRTTQGVGDAANTLSTVADPQRMFKLYTWHKNTEDLMTQEIILAPKQVVKNASDEFSYYLTITPPLDAPSYASPLLNLEVLPHPMGVPSSTKELTLRLAATRVLGTLEASGQIVRLDAPEKPQQVRATFSGVNAQSIAEAKIPVSFAPKGRYRLELQLSQNGKVLLPGLEVNDRDAISIPIVTNDVLSVAKVYEPRVAGGKLFPTRMPQTVSASLAFDGKDLKIFRLPTTQRAFENDTFKANSKKTQPVELHAAANEYQSLQLVLTGQGQQPSTLPVAASSLRGPKNAEIKVDRLSRFLYAQTEVPSRYSPNYPLANYPDALLSTQSIELKPGIATPLFITYKVAPGTPPGTYKGQVQIGANKVPVSLKVWNYELPTRPLVDIPTAQKSGGHAVDEIYQEYKLTPATLKLTYDLLADKWDAVKQQMPLAIERGLTRTLLGNSTVLLKNPGIERIREIDAFLKENGWTEYFYVRPGLDEATPDKIPELVARLKAWKAVSKIKTMETYYNDDGAEQLFGLIDIWCRQAPAPWFPERAARGDEFWRVNAMPSALESNLPTMWAAYLKMADDGFTGTYLWTVTAYGEMEWGKDWWTDAGVGNLEATLIWKHDTGFLPTIRLEALRDIIEGYTSYAMLKKRVANPRPGDNKKLLARARALTDGTISQRIVTDADVEKVRDEIGEVLSALNASA
jgi:hypothetical protein